MAGSTASRAVLFSGMTVVLALVGMLIVPTKIFVSLAAGAILVVLVAVVSALTLLPAVLGLLGDRVESLRVPFFGRRAQTTTAPHEASGARTVDLVMRHPVIAVVGHGRAAAARCDALPQHQHRRGRHSPRCRTALLAKQGFVVLNRDFTVGGVTPATMVVDGDVAAPAAAEAFRSSRTALAQDDRVRTRHARASHRPRTWP